MLCFTELCKDMLQERLMILMSFCFKFIGVYTDQQLCQYEKIDRVTAKIKWHSFLPHIVVIGCRRILCTPFSLSHIAFIL